MSFVYVDSSVIVAMMFDETGVAKVKGKQSRNLGFVKTCFEFLDGDPTDKGTADNAELEPRVVEEVKVF